MTNVSEALAQAKEIIEAQDAELKRIAASALEAATVVAVTDKHIFYGKGPGSVFRANKPPFALRVGDPIAVYTETNQIIDIMPEPFAYGSMAVVKHVLGERFCEIEKDGQTLYCLTGNIKLEQGDRVIIDSSESIVIKTLGKDQKSFTPTNVRAVTWDMIGGLEEAKQQMREAVEMPHMHKELFAHYGKGSPRGVLLYGPPGCGKTLLAKAAAYSLANIYQGEDSPDAFIYIKGPEILNKYVGESEATIRTLFARARAHHAKHGYPAVIFIDEAESVLAARGSNEGSGARKMSSTIVPMFLAEMDGLQDTGALVILATNRPGDLDSAIVRDGRIDRKIAVTRPTPESARDILLLNLRGKPLANGYTAEDLADLAVQEVFNPKRVFYGVATDTDVHTLTLAHLLNGAMLAGVVDHAISLALHRDLAAGTMTGISRADMFYAVGMIDRQNRDTDHSEALHDLMEPFKDSVQDVKKIPHKAFKYRPVQEAA